MDANCPFCGAPTQGTDKTCLACLMDLALTPGEDQDPHTLGDESSVPGTATPAAPAASAPIQLQPGDRIGAYVIERVLGEGGMGVVYLAQQSAPVQRPVAIKVIKLGLDTGSVLTRFQAEQQALARMEHDGIARLFEAGQTPEGRPYFAMEYIDGETITDYCDSNKLGVRERLDLFKQVCSAVQHAHQKGVVHRDLKPSNILVSIHDDGRAGPDGHRFRNR